MKNSMKYNLKNYLQSYRTFSLLAILMVSSCTNQTTKTIPIAGSLITPEKSYYGTLEPFASEAVYFLMTDRFVDGDASNNFVGQGGQYPTFQNPLTSPDGRKAYVGYMGGDFKGILENADYIKSMGFTSIWLTPIVDQPNEAFSGGEPIEFGGAFRDGGKTGYHGYWGVNFFKVDEHLPSTDLSFKQLTAQLRNNFQIKTVLDVVLNHGSPAFSMPEQRDEFGKIYDKNNQLIADHANLSPKDLDYNNPLQYFYNKNTEIVQLSDINEKNPKALAYFTDAYLYWIEQGADAFRIDTIKHMPHEFWKQFSDNIRNKHSDFFMFAESYSFDANFIAKHTLDKNGAVSVLDFPGRQLIIDTFENSSSDFSDITSYLYLEDSPYKNSYELMTFYDNHDMQRMNADNHGFIDAHNWLFTSRGIPVIYYGSEIGFMAGTKEHEGNRNYYGNENIKRANKHPVKESLSRIANLRKHSIALQKGLHVNLDFGKDTASFLRIYQHENQYQTALVLLNKGDTSKLISVGHFLSKGLWTDAFNNQQFSVNENGSLSVSIEPHQVKVLFYEKKNTNKALLKKLDALMKY